MYLNKLLELLIGNFFFSILEGDGGGVPSAGDSGAGDGGEPPAGDPDLVSEGWLKGVPNEFASDPIMGNVKDVSTLVKNYVNAQRMIGRKGVILPDENSGEDKWNEFYTQLGRPEAADKYGLQSEKLNEEFVNKFSEEAYKAGLLPKQANQLMGFYNEMVDREEQASQQAAEQAEAEAVEQLRAEWGQGFDTQLHKARAVAQQFGGEDMIEHLSNIGVGSDPKVLKFLAKIGESMNEDQFERTAVSNFNMTPDQANQELEQHMAEGSPYWKPDHQDHTKIRQRVEHLYKIIS